MLQLSASQDFQNPQHASTNQQTYYILTDEYSICCRKSLAPFEGRRHKSRLFPAISHSRLQAAIYQKASSVSAGTLASKSPSLIQPCRRSTISGHVGKGPETKSAKGIQPRRGTSRESPGIPRCNPESRPGSAPVPAHTVPARRQTASPIR